MADTEWDQVWSDYDARRQASAVVGAVVKLPTDGLGAARPPRPIFEDAASPIAASPGLAPRSARLVAWAILPLIALGWVGAAYATAWNLALALDGRDHGELSRHVNPAALQGAVRAALHPGPAAPEGEQASAFLAAMADDIAAGWAAPAALAEVARARGVRPGATAVGLRHAMPVGLTRFEMPLPGAASPMTLQLELRNEGLAPRWQVTGVRLDHAAPSVGPGPAMRFSAIR